MTFLKAFFSKIEEFYEILLCVCVCVCVYMRMYTYVCLDRDIAQCVLSSLVTCAGVGVSFKNKIQNQLRNWLRLWLDN